MRASWTRWGRETRCPWSRLARTGHTTPLVRASVPGRPDAHGRAARAVPGGRTTKFALNNNAAGVFTAAGVGPGGFDLMEYGIAHPLRSGASSTPTSRALNSICSRRRRRSSRRKRLLRGVRRTHGIFEEKAPSGDLTAKSWQRPTSSATFAFDGVVVAARPGAWPFDQSLDLFSRRAPRRARPETDLSPDRPREACRRRRGAPSKRTGASWGQARQPCNSWGRLLPSSVLDGRKSGRLPLLSAVIAP